MKLNVKAALLSALILPGLGQLYKGEKVKGAVLIIIVNIFLLTAVYMVLKYAAPLIISAGAGGKVDANQIIDRLHHGGPAVRTLLTFFCALWLYGWIDAAVDKSRRE